MSRRVTFPGDGAEFVRVTDRGSVEKAAAAMAPFPIGVAFRAAAEGRLVLGCVTSPRAAFPNRLIKDAEARGSAVLLIVGDDPHGARSLGPDGWACARRLSGWARFALVHAAGAEPGHYERAVAAAEEHRAAVLVECGTSTFPLWAAFLRARHKLCILPRGGAHPIGAVLH